MKIKHIVKGILVPIIEPLIRIKNMKSRIVFWHGVGENPDPLVEAEVIDIQDFLKQLDYLEKHFEIISIGKFEERYTNKKLTGKEVVLTFDDGYANNLYVLAPIMKERHIPYTVFISTAHIETGKYFPTSIARIVTLGSKVHDLELASISKTYSLRSLEERLSASKDLSRFLKTLPLNQVEQLVEEMISHFTENEWTTLKEKYNLVRPMNWDEVIRLKELGAEIGSHCQHHICCHSNQQEMDLQKEIEESKRIIEEKVGTSCKYFAYPNGDNTHMSNEIVRSNYNFGFTTLKSLCVTSNHDSATVPRIGLPYNFDTFVYILNSNPKK